VCLRGTRGGFGLVEVLVALALGTFVSVAALAVYARSAADSRTNFALQRLHETARIAADALEQELRAAAYFGDAPDALVIEGRTRAGAAPPAGLEVAGCTRSQALDLERAVVAADDAYALEPGVALDCRAAPAGRPRAGSDTLTVRRARMEPGAAEPGSLQLATTRTRGRLFADGRTPLLGRGVRVYDLEVGTYYVAEDSTEARGVPSLRRKRLVGGSSPAFQDEELASGVEDLQVEFGLDGPDADEVPERYATAAERLPEETPRTVRFWLLVRADDRDPTWRDLRAWRYSNREIAPTGDAHRRVLVSRTVFLRSLRRS
jgi:type IV pilus assembly protein PilW